MDPEIEQETEIAPYRAEHDRSTSRRVLLIAGGVGAAGIVAGVTIAGLLRNPNDASTSLLDTVPPDALMQIQPTLTPANAVELIDNAQRCHEPLARVAIMSAPGTRGGVISIRSGAYQTPRFVLTVTPALVAFPFPAPYPSGHGTLVVEGDASDLIIALTPRKVVSFSGSSVIPVRWTPAGACQ